jgi:hypothetical protein
VANGGRKGRRKAAKIARLEVAADLHLQSAYSRSEAMRKKPWRLYRASNMGGLEALSEDARIG